MLICLNARLICGIKIDYYELVLNIMSKIQGKHLLMWRILR